MTTNAPPHGDPRIPDRMWRQTTVTDGGCWTWTGVLMWKGYGRVNYQRKTRSCHRVFWELLMGPIEGDLTVDHLCRNRACQNPAHMELVTRQENMARGVAARRAARQAVAA